VVAAVAEPLVSIVTPSFNQADYLEETILSVLQQDYANVEYYVMDGGSTDGSVEIIRAYEDRLAGWVSQPDGGQAHALNKGFGLAKGDYLGWLCSDDTYLPGAIATLVGALERDPAAALAYGDAVYTDELSELKDPAPSGRWDPPQMVRTAQVPNQQPATLYRRSAWEAAGPLDERAWYYLDYELTVRLAGVGGGIRIPEQLATYRIHPDGKSTGRPVLKAEDALRCADEFMTSNLVPEPLRVEARAGRAALHRVAGQSFYAALELGQARRAYLRAAALAPRALPPSALKTFLPTLVVRRLRARRLARVRPVRDRAR
jgi:glycosyltransferase involved in cell wall biosynthesis